MSANSSIEWTDASWNPIRGIAPNRHMCRKISPGCDHCYSSAMTRRFGGQEFPSEPTPIEVRLDTKALMLPLSWKKPQRVFVCSMTDLFGEWVPDDDIDEVVGIMAMAEQHQFQVLTKRPSRMLSAVRRWQQKFETQTPYLQAVGSGPSNALVHTEVWWATGATDEFRWPLPNVWLGTSIELDRYTWRANVLRDCPASVRFISAEPLLGPLPSLNLTGINWLIAGGESGIGHRPMEADWVRDLRDRSLAAGTAFFYKQFGGRTHAEGGRLLDGRTWDEYPQAVLQ